ncbi:hypothetical protein ACF0H5_019309 [Mactra antiquata]
MGCVSVKLDKNNKSKKDSPSTDTNQNLETLTTEQKTLIRNNWQVLKCHVANIGVITYVSMFENRPELIHIFASFKGRDVSELEQTGLLRQHALRVMATIDKCITRLDEPANMQNILKEVGIHHVRYKVPAEYLEDILPHFLSAIKPHIGDEWNEQSTKAWTIFLSIVVYYIKDGMKC